MKTIRAHTEEGRYGTVLEVFISWDCPIPGGPRWRSPCQRPWTVWAGAPRSDTPAPASCATPGSGCPKPSTWYSMAIMLWTWFLNTVFRIRIRIHRIHMFLGLPNPDSLVRGVDQDPNSSIILQSSSKNSKQNLNSYCFWLLLGFLSSKWCKCTVLSKSR